MDLLPSVTRVNVRNDALGALLLAGYVEDVRRLSSELSATSTGQYWYADAVMKYHQTPTDPDKFVAGAGPVFVQQSEALFAVALNELAAGDPSSARTRLQGCLDRGAFHSFNYFWATALLRATGDDPVWLLETVSNADR